VTVTSALSDPLSSKTRLIKQQQSVQIFHFFCHSSKFISTAKKKSIQQRLEMISGMGLTQTAMTYKTNFFDPLDLHLMLRAETEV